MMTNKFLKLLKKKLKKKLWMSNNHCVRIILSRDRKLMIRWCNCRYLIVLRMQVMYLILIIQLKIQFNRSNKLKTWKIWYLILKLWSQDFCSRKFWMFCQEDIGKWALNFYTEHQFMGSLQPNSMKRLIIMLQPSWFWRHSPQAISPHPCIHQFSQLR